jgi:hypothetical protein
MRGASWACDTELAQASGIASSQELSDLLEPCRCHRRSRGAARCVPARSLLISVAPRRSTLRVGVRVSAVGQPML